MRKPLVAIVALFATVAVGLVALLAHGAGSRTDLAQTLGVAPAGPVADLAAGQQVCQTPISLADGFQRVQFFPTATTRATPALAVTVRDTESHALLGRARVAAGFSPSQPQTVRVGQVPSDRRVSVCFHDLGPRRVRILGDSVSGRFCTPTG